MRREILIGTTAMALLAMVTSAPAQVREPAGPGVSPKASEPGSPAQQRMEDQGKGAPAAGERARSNSGKKLDDTTGQSNPAAKDAPRGRDENKAPPARRGKKEQDQTQGQGRPADETPPAGKDRAPTGKDRTPAGKDRAPTGKDQKPPSPTEGQGSGGSAGAALSVEQRNRVKQSIHGLHNAPRVAKVSFSLTVGAVVPRSVRLATVPTVIVEIVPAWRGYLYFLVGDEIIVVEPRTLKIVAVIEA